MRRGTLVLYKKRNEFRWLCLTCVASYHVNIVGAFIEGLPRSEGQFFPTAYLHHNCPLQHVDKHVCIVSVYGFRTAWRVRNSNHRAFFSRDVGEISRKKGGHLNLLSR